MNMRFCMQGCIRTVHRPWAPRTPAQSSAWSVAAVCMHLQALQSLQSSTTCLHSPSSLRHVRLSHFRWPASASTANLACVLDNPRRRSREATNVPCGSALSRPSPSLSFPLLPSSPLASLRQAPRTASSHHRLPTHSCTATLLHSTHGALPTPRFTLTTLPLLTPPLHCRIALHALTLCCHCLARPSSSRPIRLPTFHSCAHPFCTDTTWQGLPRQPAPGPAPFHGSTGSSSSPSSP